MEATLALLSLQDEAATTLTSLPPELLLDIASHLPLGPLARFSLVSRFVRDAVQPQLYKTVQLWSLFNDKSSQEKLKVVRSVLSSLAADPERCSLMRELDLREWHWMGSEEVDNLELVIRQARGLKMLQLLNAGEVEAKHHYVPFFPRAWRAVLSLPSLEALCCYAGPVVPLELHRQPSLRRLILGDYDVYPHEDGTLPRLTELTLDTVHGFTTAWFRPELLGSLETLVLSWLDEEATDTVTRIFEAWEGKSALRNLTVDLYLSEPPLSALALVSLLQAALKLNSLSTLEIHSTPWHSQTPSEAFDALEQTLPLGTTLEHLVLAMARSRPTMFQPKDLARLCRLLEKLPRLVTFKTDLATAYFDLASIPQLISRMRSIGAPVLTQQIERLPLPEEARILFGGHASLKEVVIRGDEVVEDHPTDPLVVFERGASGEIMRVCTAESWRGKVVRTFSD